eukprot:TRINITY_DN11250_c0_g1_i1.p1 TRINITY_DN11250_c0_g1~~TRINITY_DN11250_c0_g1_i1.p1  ORF type:complete len:154 (+),score=29.37 TRINITY_DN11250_c0_g1_i1:141-602(+)
MQDWACDNENKWMRKWGAQRKEAERAGTAKKPNVWILDESGRPYRLQRAPVPTEVWTVPQGARHLEQPRQAPSQKGSAASQRSRSSAQSSTALYALGTERGNTMTMRLRASTPLSGMSTAHNVSEAKREFALSTSVLSSHYHYTKSSRRATDT